MGVSIGMCEKKTSVKFSKKILDRKRSVKFSSKSNMHAHQLVIPIAPSARGYKSNDQDGPLNLNLNPNAFDY